MSFLPVVLPRLRGAWLTLYRAIWIAAAVVVLVSAIGATWLDARPSSQSTGWQGLTQRSYGIGVRSFSTVGPGNWRIASAFSPEAIASGIHAGDAIVGLNGHAVTTVTPISSLVEWLGHREGENVHLRLRSANGAIRDHVLVYHERNVQRWYSGSGLNPNRQYLLRRFAYDLMTLLLLGVSVLLFLRRSHDPVAGAFSLGLCLIPVGPAVEFWAAIHANTAYDVLSSLPYIVILMAGCAFPDGRYWPSWTRFSLILAPAILVPAIFSVIEYSQFTLFTAPGYLAVVAILAVRYRRLGPGIERQQFRWVAFGLAAGVITLLLRLPFALFQATLTPAPLSSWIDLAGSLLHALGFAIIGAGFGVSLLKYRLYDAESVIGRSAALTATTLMLAGLWAALEKAIETFLPDIVGKGHEAISGVVCAGLAVVLIAPIHGRVHGWIDERFKNGVYRLRERLPALLETMSQSVSTKQLCEQGLAYIARDVRVTRAALVLQNADDVAIAACHLVERHHVRAWLETGFSTEKLDNDSDDLFVLRQPLLGPLNDKPIGWLLLGSRPDGTPPNRDERDALAKISSPLARAILATQTRDVREDRIAAALTALETRLSSVEARLMATPETA